MAHFDPSDDFARLIDRTEPVTLCRRDAQDAGTAVLGLRLAMTTREAAESDGRYWAADLVWHLPAAELAAKPELGDAIVDAAGVRHTILETRLATLGSRWRCVTRIVAIDGAGTETVDVLRAAWGKDTDGAPLADWQVVHSGVLAQIHAAAICDGKPTLRIFLAQRVPTDDDLRIRTASGVLYAVTQVVHPQSLDQLTTLEAEFVR